MDLGYKHQELLAFFYSILEESSPESLSELGELLKILNVGKKELQKTKIKKGEFKDVLKAVFYNNKIKLALKESEPPQKTQEFIDKTIKEAIDKIREFFGQHKDKQPELRIKEDSGRSFTVEANRGFFVEDKRILPTVEGLYKFDFRCYYRKESQELEISLFTDLRVRESEISSITFSNITIFDDFARYLGFSSEPDVKNVYFNAIFSEGELLYDNTCNIEWKRTIGM